MNLKVRTFFLSLITLGLLAPTAQAQQSSNNNSRSRRPQPQRTQPQRTAQRLPRTQSAAVSTATDEKPAKALAPLGTPEWIWSPLYTPGNAPQGNCFFRKAITIRKKADAKIDIACDNRYELYVNGEHVGKGATWNQFNTFEIGDKLVVGQNMIAVKASNESAGSAGLIARITILEGIESRVVTTDATWKTQLQQHDGWEEIVFDDARWKKARSIGALGVAEPWGAKLALPGASRMDRFKHAPDFFVERVISPEKTGSVIAFTFNEWGEAILSQEGGSLVIATDADRDGSLESVTPYCEEVKNCQGLLALNGVVYAVGDGPEGPALYALGDENHDGKVDRIKMLVPFKGTMGEHGPHALQIGPDGYLYVMIGNHTGLKEDASEDSPYHHYYEGDLISKQEDAGGHAVGIKAPGGSVLRMTADGKDVQLYAGGLRNAYDLAFNRQGELFTADSDMEWDAETPWYRPTRVSHITAGAEFGWRSGWSKWPDYYLDSARPVIDIGRGSPTGVEVYDHYKYPVRYQNSLFVCDWAQGQILSIKLTPVGGSYEAKKEVFLEGSPLNATDIAVGVDGWLYFTTGGRGTEGGLYRIVWNGLVPPLPQQRGIGEAIRQPQLASAFTRQKIALIQEQMGEEWGPQLKAVAQNLKNTPADRCRALDLMQLFGPVPDAELLIKLSKDQIVDVRVKSTILLGLQTGEAAGDRLVDMLEDKNPTVRRMACESLVRGKFMPPLEKITQLLKEPSPYVNAAARRALQTLPIDEWQDEILNSKNDRVFLEGSMALLALKPDAEVCVSIIERGQERMERFLTDPDFLDLLRVFEIAIHQGELKPEELTSLASDLANEYPSAEPRMNRELIRLCAYLQADEILPRVLEVLAGDTAPPEKLHAALYSLRFSKGWSGDQKFTLLKYLSDVRKTEGAGHSFSGYIDNCSRDFVKDMHPAESDRVLADGEKWPAAALAVLSAMEVKPTAERVEDLIELDGRLRGSSDEDVKKLGVGIVAVLGISHEANAMAYLREQFDIDPERRGELAMGLAQVPQGENYEYLLKALPVLEGAAAQEVLLQLAKVDLAPEDAEPYRQAILCGLRLGESNGILAVRLLEKWAGQTQSNENDSWSDALSQWQTWYSEKYPDASPATLPQSAKTSKWNVSELLAYMQSHTGDVANGAKTFERAQCNRCHRYRNKGEGLGPDLTAVAQRFQKKEILESILFPSHTISDQYASKTIVTTDGLTYTGIVGSAGEGAVVVLQSSGEKVRLKKDNIEEMAPSKQSAMPDGLLDKLTLDEITDLMSYLTAPVSETVRKP